MKTDADHRALQGLAIVFAGGLFIWGMELPEAILGSIPFAQLDVGPGAYLALSFALVVGLFALIAGPVWGLGTLVERWVPPALYWVVVAGLFGLSWQQTLVQGDGIRAHAYFPAIRIALLVGVPVLCGLFVYGVLLRRWFSRPHSVLLAGLALVGGMFFNLLLFLDYQAFHGHLAVANGVLVAWLAYPYRRRLRPKIVVTTVGLVLVASSVKAVGAGGDHLRYLQRFSHLPTSILDAVPYGDRLQHDPDPVLEFDRQWDQQQHRDFERQFRQRSAGPPAEGDNVLLVVLETVRWDEWGDDELTPRFSEWKRHGLYLPESVAQYPATPLAYGAMFLSQPPSVLASTSYWSDHRLFDEISGSFDELILSQPDERWFEHTAITDFFLDPERDVRSHATAPEGLNDTRRRIEDLEDDESFFGWIHLYEPHAPYQYRPEFDRGGDDDRHRAYRSEVAYVDEHLGDFMDWFFEHPIAEDTLVVVVSDHGEGFGEQILGEPFWGHHVHVHNVVSRIPMFVAGGSFPEGRTRTDIQAAQLDVMPTVFDFLGVSMPSRLHPQGVALQQLRKQDEPRTIPTEAFSIRGIDFFDFVRDTGHTDDPESLRRRFRQISIDGSDYSPKLAIEHDGHKLIYDRITQQYWMYDVDRDPYETNDLLEEYPQRAEAMKQQLEDWKATQSWVVQQLTELPRR